MNFKNPIFYTLAIFIIIVFIMIVKFWGMTELEISNDINLVEFWKKIRGWTYLISFFGFSFILLPATFFNEIDSYKNGIKKAFFSLILFVVLINMSYWISLNIYLALDYYLPISTYF